jgi:hypothetical protein
MADDTTRAELLQALELLIIELELLIIELELLIIGLELLIIGLELGATELTNTELRWEDELELGAVLVLVLVLVLVAALLVLCGAPVQAPMVAARVMTEARR